MEPDFIEKIVLSEPVEISVVIPHFSSSRSDNMAGLLQDLRSQTVKGMEILLVKGVSPQGRAINEGVKISQGKTLIVLDDDSRIGHPQVLERLIQALRDNPDIGMAGASILTPPNANDFQKKAAKQFPRFNMPIVDKITDSDLTCHGCVAFPKDVFIKVKMERDDILRGLDPDLRVRMRKAGYRVVLVPQTWAYHPLPPTFWKFLRTFVRNGYGSAYMQSVHPELNYDTDESVDSASFVPKRSLFYRILRYPGRLLQSLVTFQWLRLAGYTVYIFGYLMGFVQVSILGKKLTPQK